MNSSTVLHKIPETLLTPPRHKWDGPQPGLVAQADETRRFHYSPASGALESIIQYRDSGVPDFRVTYKQGKPHEVEIWNGTQYISYGLVDQSGRIVREHSLPRYMIDVDGSVSEIPRHDTSVFYTPDGLVVRTTKQGIFFKKTRAQFLGKIKDFSPLQPFMMRGKDRVEEIPIDRRDILIDTQGVVYQNGADGLQAIGEVALRERVARSEVGPLCVSHELCVITLHPTEENPYKALRINHIDPEISQFINGPLHKITGAHPFLRDHTPELVDVYGSHTAEQQLRIVERLALEVGIARYATKHASSRSDRGAFMRAQQHLETMLWEQVVELERVVDMQRHELVDPAYIRAWIDEASEHPHDAIIRLRRKVSRADRH